MNTKELTKELEWLKSSLSWQSSRITELTVEIQRLKTPTPKPEPPKLCVSVQNEVQECGKKLCDNCMYRNGGPCTCGNMAGAPEPLVCRDCGQHFSRLEQVMEHQRCDCPKKRPNYPESIWVLFNERGEPVWYSIDFPTSLVNGPGFIALSYSKTKTQTEDSGCCQPYVFAANTKATIKPKRLK
jgi:hypothetical protein